MTKNIIVADDVVGRIAIKQHELMRRVLEGTLVPTKVADSLQLIIQGKPVLHVSEHDFETLPFVMSDRSYNVTVDRSLGPLEAIKRAGISVDQSRVDDVERTHFRLNGGPTKAKYKLARFLRRVEYDEAVVLLSECGYLMTDLWELMAFACVFHGTRYPKQSFMMFALDTLEPADTLPCAWCLDVSPYICPVHFRPFNSGIPAKGDRADYEGYVLVRLPD